MRKIVAILKQKKLQFWFLFYILLLLPILSPFAENLSILDKFAVFGVCGLLFISMLVVSTFISSTAEKFIYSILLILSIIPGAIFLAYLLFANVLLEQNSVTSLFETTPEESKEFLTNYLSFWVTAGVLVYTAIPIVMIAKMKSFKPLVIKQYKYIFTLSLLVIISIASINTLSRSVYFINFYKTFVSYKVRVHKEVRKITERQQSPFSIHTSYPDSLPQTIVVVVGESLSRAHLSLYDYPRNTNPLLSQRNDSLLYVYKDVISPQVHTIPVLRSILSMEEPSHPEYFTEKPSVFELFNRANYETYLLSNQGFSLNYDSSYDILLSLAKHKYNFAPLQQHDDIVIAKLKEIVQEQKTKNKLIVIHLIGNHMAYEFRYSKEFLLFDYEEDGLVADSPFRDAYAKIMIDKYDNSVAYNDYLVNSVIATLEKSENKNTAMIYLSDHGEELYDYRKFAGHAYEKVSPTMCEVPFMVWLSDMYKKNHPTLTFDIHRPYSTADFIYSLSDISGLEYTDFDKKRSIFSNQFVPRQRLVGEKTYEEVKAKFAVK